MKRTVLLLIIFTLLSKIMGFSRELVLAYYYGASAISDAYFISILIPTVFYTIIGTGLATAIVPILVKIADSNDQNLSNSFIKNILIIIFILSSILIVITEIFIVDIINWYASGFSEETKYITITLTRVTLVSIFANLFIAVITGILQVNKKFIQPALIGLLMNVVVIIGIFVSSKYGYTILSYSFVFASLMQLIYLFIILYRLGFNFRANCNLTKKEIINLFKLAIPSILGQLILQITVLVDRAVITHQGYGAVSALNYADKVNSLIIQLAIMGLNSVLYPILSILVVKKDYNKLITIVNKSIKLLILILLPFSIILYFYSETVIKILFYRGEFSNRDVLLTSSILKFISLGILFIVIKDLLLKIMYAFEDFRNPMQISLFVMIINVISTITLVKIFGLVGVGISISIIAVLTTIILCYLINKKISNLILIKSKLKLIIIIIIFSVSFLLMYKQGTRYFNINESIEFVIVILIFTIYTALIVSKNKDFIVR